MEVPEVFSGVVEIKSVAREAGYRSKVAVAARQEGIDPVGCCVGLRGIRIQNIMRELNSEKLDVVAWDPDASVFIASALSPAQVLSVELDEEEGIATVIVPDRQLSLAIGKEGQNARLAAKLTGWRIDIKSASIAEAEKLAATKPLTEVAEVTEETVVSEELPAELPAIEEPELVPEEAKAEAKAKPEAKAEPEPATLETELVSPETILKPPVGVKAGAKGAKLRFAEDVMQTAPTKPTDKFRRKKKKETRERGEDGIKVKKRRQKAEVFDEDEEEY
jgi:N utilization substance protein A